MCRIVKWQDRVLEYTSNGKKENERIKTFKDRNTWRDFCRGHPLKRVLRNGC